MTDTTNANSIFDSRLVYDKGCHAAAHAALGCGRLSLFAGTRNYLNDPQLKHNYALTQDFRQHLEQASGMSLGGFFQDWIYGQGYPRYQIGWLQDAQTGVVTVTIGQNPTHPSVSFFELPVPIRFSSAGQDTLLVFQHTASGQVFSFTPGFQVSSVALDPDKWLVQRSSTITSRPAALLAAADFSVFPNPGTGRYQLRFTQPLQPADRVEISNLLGRQTGQPLLLPAGTLSAEADLTGQQAGVYLLQYRTAAGTVTRKLVHLGQ